MKVVVAMDSMKGSLTSREAGNAAREGILRAIPDAVVTVHTVADGGEGTAEALVEAYGGRYIHKRVTGPYGESVDAVYGYIESRNLAVLEVASAAGLTLSDRRDPLRATSYGVGELILDAVSRGCRNFIVGLGGSASNDAGLGMLSALGFIFRDKRGDRCGIFAESLSEVASVSTMGVTQELKECRFSVACDVTNPLCGTQGATYVFGPQKGVTAEQREPLDRAMSHFASVLEAELHAQACQIPGAGAAGGLGFAFLSCLHAWLRPGIEVVLHALRLEESLRDAAFVLTGEGCLDGQTAMGKTPIGVAALAKCFGVPVIALAGAVKPEARACNACGINAFFPILPAAMPLEQAMEPACAAENIARTAEQVFRLIACVTQSPSMPEKS